MKAKYCFFNKVLTAFTCLVTVLGVMTSCSPEKFDGASESGLPSVAGFDFDLVVDQETNMAYFTFNETDGVYPIWIVDGVEYSTLPMSSFSSASAGTHTVELKIGNRNGVSQGSVTKTFTFNKDIVDFTKYLVQISNKDWRIARKEVGHLGCGPYGTDASSWWSAQADDKEGTGLYDDIITFTTESDKGGTYTYNAGEDGKTFVNTGTTLWGASDADFDAEIGNQTAGWYFSTGYRNDADGNTTSVMYVQLDANTAFPYISDDAQYKDPRFYVQTLTPTRMVLIYDNPSGSISWRFVFTSVEDNAFSGFDVESDCNLFKSAETSITFWYADANWSQLPDPEMTTSGHTYSITLPTANTSQWQTQMAFHTDVTTNSANTYDFSVVINSDKDLKGATVKLTQEDDDNVFYFADQIDLSAGKDYVFYKVNMDGIDIPNIKLVLDFGGCQADTHIDISNIVLKEHDCDDGTTPPEEEEADVMDWTVNSESNLWLPMYTAGTGPSMIYYAPGWAQIADFTYTIDGANYSYNFTLPEATSDQWQAQAHFASTIPGSMADKYNFYCVLESSADHPGVTVKLTDVNSDDNFFFADRIKLSAYEFYVLKKKDVVLPVCNADALKLVFDFGGNAAGSEVTVTNIYFEKVQ